MRRRGVLAVVVLAAALAAASPASARTAIVQYDRHIISSRSLAHIALENGATKTHRYRVLPFVTVRGSAAQLRRIGRLRGVRSVHMDRRMKYFLHESVPVAYGGVDPRPTTWASGFDG